MQRLSIYLVLTCVLVGSAVAQGHKITVKILVAPNYPPIAKEAKIEGEVIVRLTFGSNGKVLSASSISGHPMLVNSAIESARQWEFTCHDCAPGDTIEQDVYMIYEYPAKFSIPYNRTLENNCWVETTNKTLRKKRAEYFKNTIQVIAPFKVKVIAGRSCQHWQTQSTTHSGV